MARWVQTSRTGVKTHTACSGNWKWQIVLFRVLYMHSWGPNIKSVEKLVWYESQHLSEFYLTGTSEVFRSSKLNSATCFPPSPLCSTAWGGHYLIPAPITQQDKPSRKKRLLTLKEKSGRLQRDLPKWFGLKKQGELLKFMHGSFDLLAQPALIIPLETNTFVINDVPRFKSILNHRATVWNGFSVTVLCRHLS